MAEGGAHEAPPLPEEQLATEACWGGRSRFFSLGVSPAFIQTALMGLRELSMKENMEMGETHGGALGE